jgi:hypothetical protein
VTILPLLITSFGTLAIRCSGWIMASSVSNVAETGGPEWNPFLGFRQITWRHMKLMKQSGNWNMVYGNPSALAGIFTEDYGVLRCLSLIVSSTPRRR